MNSGGISVILLVLILNSGNLYSQDRKVSGACNYLAAYDNIRNIEDLEKARKLIDAAVIHKETSGLQKAWLIRGDVYSRRYDYELTEKLKAAEALKFADPLIQAYCRVDDTLLSVASTSYLIAAQLDSADHFSEQIESGITECALTNEKAGLHTYHGLKFIIATQCFIRSFSLRQSLGQFDTLNLYYASLSAMKAQQYDRSILWASTLTQLNYKGALPWWILGECYVRSNDSINARQTVAKGMQLYPEDQLLQWLQLDLLLATGRVSEADELVFRRVGGGSWLDSTVNYKVATIYDQLAHPRGEDGVMKPIPWNYGILVARAEYFYRRALEINPRYFDAQVRLAGLLYNRAVSYLSEVNYEFDGKGFLELMVGATVEFEKARTMRPNDIGVLQGLKLCYTQSGETEKLQEIERKIEQTRSR